MAKFKIGDRILVAENHLSPFRKGLGDSQFGNVPEFSGTIVEISGGEYGIKFDDFIDGHTLGGQCEPGYGWWCTERQLKPYIQEQEPAIPLEELLNL